MILISNAGVLKVHKKLEVKRAVSAHTEVNEMCDDFTHVLSARHLMNRRTIFKRRVTLKLEQNMSNLNYSASDMYIRFNLQAVNGKHPPMKLKQVLWPQINKNTWLGWPALP